MTESAPATAPPAERRRTLVWAASITAAWLAIALWAGAGIVMAPSDGVALGGRALLLLGTAALGLIQSLKLIRVLLRRPQAGHIRRLAEIALCLMFAYVIAGWTVEAMLARHDRLIAQRLAPLVRALESGQPLPANADPRQSRSLRIWRGPGGFMLAVPGASLDIDGSTVFYDSELGRLARFHNDQAGQANARRYARRARELEQLQPRP